MLALTTRAWRRGSETPAAFAKRSLDLGLSGLVPESTLPIDSPEAAIFRQAGARLPAWEMPGGLTTLDRELFGHRLHQHLEQLERAADREVPLLLLEPGEIEARLEEDEPAPGDRRGLRLALEARAKAVGPHLDAVRQALDRIVRRAEALGRRVAVLNPARLAGIPSFQEMERFAADLKGGPFAFFLDSAAAWSIDSLGLKSLAAWTKGFASITAGLRLQDARREGEKLELRLAAGEGEVDFGALARAWAELPKEDRLLAIDVESSRDEGRLRDGLDLLRRRGLT